MFGTPVQSTVKVALLQEKTCNLTSPLPGAAKAPASKRPMLKSGK
ncbi:hypothetical protein [Nocardia sp. CA-290969]